MKITVCMTDSSQRRWPNPLHSMLFHTIYAYDLYILFTRNAVTTIPEFESTIMCWRKSSQNKNKKRRKTKYREKQEKCVCPILYESEKGERERTRGYTLKSLDARKGPLDNHFRLFTSVVVRRTKRHWHFSTISYTLVRPDCMVFGFGKYPYLYLFYIYFYPIWNVSIDRKIYIPKLNWTRHR